MVFYDPVKYVDNFYLSNLEIKYMHIKNKMPTYNFPKANKIIKHYIDVVLHELMPAQRSMKI